MGDSSGSTKRGAILRPFLPAALVVLGWFGGRFVHSDLWWTGYHFVEKVLFRALGGFPAAQQIAHYVLRFSEHALVSSYFSLLFWATLLLPLGFLARMVARSRVRAGGSDAILSLHAWTLAHPRWTRALLAVPSSLLGLALFSAERRGLGFDQPMLAYLLPALAAATAAFFAARAGLGLLLAPTLPQSEEARVEIGPDEIVFDAVAVTNETRAAVGALAGLSVAMVVWIAALPILTLFRDPRLFAGVAAYAVVALGGALVFRRASRVAVGVDGVRVAGTSRARFFAYRELDGARVTNGDLELVRRGRVVLRLQLHGADAARRDAVSARIRESIDQVKEGRDAVAAQLVASATKEQLAHVASGGADYRAASLSREALWALIEGPAVDGASRRAAAEALSRTNDEGERTRLRVAAEHCADPQVRVALEQLAETDPAEPLVPDPKQRATSTLA